MNISNPNYNRKAIVIFSGGQDSTTCLFQAIAEYGKENVETITFQYGQRHSIELEKAKWIAQDLGVKQTFIDTSVIKAITHNALMDENVHIEQKDNVTLNLAMDYQFNIKTPLMYLTKAQTWQLADELGVLDYVRNYTHTCYEGVDGGCSQCPSCILRDKGLKEYLAQKGGKNV